jgi:hypothetical protein
MLRDVLTRTRALLATVAVLVILTLMLDLMLFGPASHALDPTLPWFYRID